jgi:acyl-CoA dehydrogenase
MQPDEIPSEDGLSFRQRDLRDRARAFTAAHVTPVALHHDAHSLYPSDMIRAARAEGLLNTVIPASYGGPGLSAFEEVLIAEEVGYGCVGMWTTMGIINLATVPILFGGSDEQKFRRFGELLDGAIPAFALTEPEGGSDVAAIKTHAEKVGNEYVLTGAKRYISGTDAAQFLVTFAKTDPVARHHGISAFIVPLDSPGLAITHRFSKFAHRAYDTSDVEFDEVIVPASNLIGTEGAGFRLAMAAFDRNRPAVAAASTGLAMRALDEATAYAVERSAFGQPLVSFQAVAHKLADIAAGVEASRQLNYLAARQLDSQVRNVGTAAKAKLLATDLAMRAATEAVQIFGAAGIMHGNVAEKLFRDAKVLQIYEGTNEIQRNIVVRELLQSKEYLVRRRPIALR